MLLSRLHNDIVIMILMYVCVYSIIDSKFDQSLMSARSVNSNLITMLKFNLTEVDVTFQCNISRVKLTVHTRRVNSTRIYSKNREYLS